MTFFFVTHITIVEEKKSRRLGKECLFMEVICSPEKPSFTPVYAPTLTPASNSDRYVYQTQGRSRLGGSLQIAHPRLCWRAVAALFSIILVVSMSSRIERLSVPTGSGPYIF